MLKKIASNTFAQLVAKFFGAGLTLLTTYFTIRLAGLELYGDLTRILVLVAVGFTAIDFGLNAEGIRSSKNDSEMQQHVYKIILARLLLSILAVISLNILIMLLPGGYSSELKSVFWLGSLAIIFQGLYTSGNSWFQYKLSYWKSTISVVIGSLVGTGLTLYYLRYSPTLSHLVLANTLGYLTMAISTLFLLPGLNGFTGKRIYETFPLLRRSLTLGLIIIASVIASKIDTIILGVYRLSSEVGQYGFAYRIFDVILVLPVFVMNVIYPLSMQESQLKNRTKLISQTTKTLAIIGIFVAVLLWISSPLVNLVRPGMDLSSNVLRILAPSLPLFYITAPLMWNLIGQKKDKLVLGIYISGAVLNATLNLLLIPSYGATAAAINTGLTEGFLVLALLYFSHETTLKH
jgi:O-antigen/teichoic acid export membrane protein